MSGPDLQALATELLEELSAAHKMLAAAVAQLGTVGMISLSRRMRHEGIDSTDGGFTRAGVRVDLIQRAGEALRELDDANAVAAADAMEALYAPHGLDITVAECLSAHPDSDTLTFRPLGRYNVGGGFYVLMPADRFNELVVMEQADFDEFLVAAQSCALRDACIAPAAIAARAVHTRAQEVQS